MKQYNLKLKNGYYYIVEELQAPLISTKECLNMLQEGSIFEEYSYNIIKYWYLAPNFEATTKEIITLYNLKFKNFNGVIVGLSKRVIKFLNKFIITLKKTS